MMAAQVKNAIRQESCNNIRGGKGGPEEGKTNRQFPAFVEVAQIENDLDPGACQRSKFVSQG